MVNDLIVHEANGERTVDKTITELILSAKSGSQDAFAALKEQYRPLIDGCVYKFASSDMTDQDVEDLSQEALICFCSAVCSYDCGIENVEFGLYAKICIDNGLVSFVRSRNRRNRIRAVSLDGETDIHNASAEDDVLQSLVDRERTSALVRKINKKLSDYEKKIWWMCVSGMSVSEISRAVSADSKSVSNAIYRIRKKLRETLSESSKR